MNLKQLGTNTYVLQTTSNVGFYIYNNNKLCLIDSGSSDDDTKEIIKIIENNNWFLTTIINTHSHADHIFGNKELQDKYHCNIYASDIEIPFINFPIMTSTSFYGSNPFSELKNPFIMAKSSKATSINNLIIPGLSIIDLSGHSPGLIGILTSDDVLFVGDSYTSDKNLESYSLQYVFDVEKYLKTLSFLQKQDFRYFIASHDIIREDIKDIIDLNINNVNAIISNILEIIKDNIAFEDLIAKIFIKYHIKINSTQYFLISSTIKSYLTFLNQNKLIEFVFKDNHLIIKRIS